MDKKVLTLDEAASQLRTSKKTVMRRIAAKELNGFKDGKKWFFYQSDIDNYFERKRQEYQSKVDERQTEGSL